MTKWLDDIEELHPSAWGIQAQKKLLRVGRAAGPFLTEFEGWVSAQDDPWCPCSEDVTCGLHKTEAELRAALQDEGGE